ncbi:TIGR03364 family FAD-dependent oxidoreductase [Krasilnikovia sp. MM14-A1259]|uniref:TIGR03364 family FAD-dependent oxidoreductase n=1 Tax=Krasilnikovia sp. MM14-A1259 TaxID=3373539 RepID=UPI00399C5DA6
MTSPRPFDMVVVGAGVVGLGHAVHAAARGARVAVVERGPRALGASVRNFGHGCVTAQAGVALNFAMAARQHWLRLADEAGFWLRDTGTVVVARAEDEYTVLEDFHAERGEDVVLLDAAAVRDRVPGVEAVVGGAWLPLDLRVDAREAVASIAAWLAGRGVEFRWSTSVLGVEGDVVRTSRGDLRAAKVVVAIGHDVDRLYPDVAAGHSVLRCSLHMLELDDPMRAVVDPAVLTGWSLMRYDGFAVSPALDRVRERLRTADPASVEAGLNLMFTQRPTGEIVFGDTHDYADAVPPFRSEDRDDLLLRHARQIFGAQTLRIRARWRGVYAAAPRPFLVAAPNHTPNPDVRIVSVTSGIGMTTGFGLAEHVVDDLLT